MCILAGTFGAKVWWQFIWTVEARLDLLHRWIGSLGIKEVSLERVQSHGSFVQTSRREKKFTLQGKRKKKIQVGAPFAIKISVRIYQMMNFH